MYGVSQPPRQSRNAVYEYKAIMTENVATSGAFPSDGRQSDAALAIRRGTQRLLANLGHASLPEVTLPSGRRADLVAITATGQIWIVEIKSSIADFRSDAKWTEYRAFSDRLLFAVAPEFPVAMIPDDVGLVIADRFGAEIVRESPEQPLAPARRKSLHLGLARLAASRLHAMADPDLRLDLYRL